MPTNAVVERALSAMDADSAKVLGVAYNGKPITAKEFIPRAGERSLTRRPYPHHEPDLTTKIRGPNHA